MRKYLLLGAVIGVLFAIIIALAAWYGEYSIAFIFIKPAETVAGWIATAFFKSDNPNDVWAGVPQYLFIGFIFHLLFYAFFGGIVGSIIGKLKK